MTQTRQQALLKRALEALIDLRNTGTVIIDEETDNALIDNLEDEVGIQQQEIITVESAIASGCCRNQTKELSRLLGVNEITADDLVSRLLEAQDINNIEMWRGLVAFYLTCLTNKQRITLARNSTPYWRMRVCHYLSDPADETLPQETPSA